MRGNLLVRLSGRDMRQDFSFARRQRFKSEAKLGERTSLLAAGPVPFDTGVDGIEQLLFVQRFGEELDGSRFDGAHRHGNIPMTADEDDWEMNVGASQKTLKLKPARPRQSD